MTDEPSTPALRSLAAAGVPHRVVRTRRAGSAQELDYGDAAVKLNGYTTAVQATQKAYAKVSASIAA